MAEIHSIVRDYLTATTYRRLELAGRKWDVARAGAGGGPLPHDAQRGFTPPAPAQRIVAAKARRLSTPLPPVPGEATAPLDGLTESERLSLVLRYAALPLRWEPGNAMVEHRGVPSAGGLYPLEILLLAGPRGEARRARLRCSPQELALIEEAEGGPAVWTGPVEIRITARLGRCAEEYGDLALSLAALEAGMCIAQLRILLALVGWPSEGRLPDRTGAAEIGLTHWSDIVLASLATTLPAGAVDGLPLEPVAVHVEDTSQSAEKFPLLRAVCHLLDEPQDRPEPGASGPLFPAAAPARRSGDGCALLQATARRSSGHSPSGGLRIGASPPDELDLLLADVLELIDASCRGSLTDEAEVVLIHRCAASGAVDCLRLDPRSGALAPLARSDAVRETAAAMAGEDQALLVTIGIDEVSVLQALGPRGLLACYAAAGAIGQCFCIAAAGRGMAARPLRSYQDREADLLLPVRARTFLQVRIGLDHPGNIAFPAL